MCPMCSNVSLCLCLSSTQQAIKEMCSNVLPRRSCTQTVDDLFDCKCSQQSMPPTCSGKRSQEESSPTVSKRHESFSVKVSKLVPKTKQSNISRSSANNGIYGAKDRLNNRVEKNVGKLSETTKAKRHSLGGESREQRRGQSPWSSSTFRGTRQGVAASSTISMVMEMFRAPLLGPPSL